jgi:hypothetical protein
MKVRFEFFLEFFITFFCLDLADGFIVLVQFYDGVEPSDFHNLVLLDLGVAEGAVQFSPCAGVDAFVGAGLTADVLAEAEHHGGVRLEIVVGVAQTAAPVEYFQKGLDKVLVLEIHADQSNACDHHHLYEWVYL